MELKTLIMNRLAATINKLYDEGKRHFLCGMADGFDLLAGLAVLDAKRRFHDITLTCVIPYPGQCRGFSRDDREAYEEILEGADRRFTISPGYVSDCFHRRNDYMVENSGTLVCWYDGSPGGTHYTIKAASRRGLTLYNIYDSRP